MPVPCAKHQDSGQYSVFHVGGPSLIQQKPCGCQGLEVGMHLLVKGCISTFSVTE